MAVLEDLDRVTNHLLAVLEGKLPVEDNRDAFIEEINKVLQIRDSLIKKLVPPYTDEELVLGQKIAKSSQLIPEKLEIFQKQMKQEWGHIQQSKKTARAYEQVYSGVSIDGMYYDKRN